MANEVVDIAANLHLSFQLSYPRVGPQRVLIIRSSSVLPVIFSAVPMASVKLLH